MSYIVFFKQKTAYEMRISDWSSDVCSSDLNNVKRMLAYSSIAHFGYCMVALVAGGPLAVEAVGAYLLTYVVTSIGAFGVVTLSSSPMGERDADAIYDYRGLFWRRPYLASILTAMLLSLAGIPLTAGLIGNNRKSAPEGKGG